MGTVGYCRRDFGILITFSRSSWRNCIIIGIRQFRRLRGTISWSGSLRFLLFYNGALCDFWHSLFIMYLCIRRVWWCIRLHATWIGLMVVFDWRLDNFTFSLDQWET